MRLNSNLLQLFSDRVQKQSPMPCLHFFKQGRWCTLTWQQVSDQVQNLSENLHQLGIQMGDAVAILAKTRHEWTLADLAILGVGGVVVPIYESSTSEQIEFILDDSGAKLLFVENQKLFERFLKIKNRCASVKNVIFFSELKSTDSKILCHNFKVLCQKTKEAPQIFSDSQKKLEPSSTASIVYTSGTTGNPKGVVLNHGHFLAEIFAIAKIISIKNNYRSMMFLPLAHILGRVVQYIQFHYGFVQCYAESLDKLSENIQQIRPHFMACVPRIFEKIHAKTLQNLTASSALKQRIFGWALKMGEARSSFILSRKPIPFFLKLKYKFAFLLVFRKLHQKLGGCFRFFISGGAPLSEEVARFFHACGFTILEGYGLTETTAAIFVNTFKKLKWGTVGPAVPGLQVKIADDGEILVKGDMIFERYHRNLEATEKAFDKEHWFFTGDIGELDPDGFLKITDRKKDIIVTAGGKKIPPQDVENLFKTDKYVSQCLVHGDKRKFLSALITLNQEEIEKFAQQQGIVYRHYSDLIKTEPVQGLVSHIVDEKNQRLASYQTIKKFAILPKDFSIESGELTPTLKIRRKKVEENYKNILNSFYYGEC